MSVGSSWRQRLMRAAVATLLAGSMAWAAGGQVASATRDRDDVEADQQTNSSQRAQVEAALEDTNSDLAKTYLDLEDTKARLPVAQQELDDATAKAEAAEREVQDLKDRLETAQEQQTDLTAQIEQGAKDIEDAKGTLAQVARSTYNGQGLDSSSLALILGVTSLDQLNSTATARNTVSRTQSTALLRLQELEATNRNRQVRLDGVMEQIGDLKTQAEQRQQEAEQARSDAQDRRDEIVALQAQQEQLAAALETQKAKYEAQDAELQAKDQQLSSELAKIAAAEKKAEEERQAREAQSGSASSGGSAGPAKGTGTLSLPLSGSVRVTSEYGQRFHPIYHVWRLHNGMDFGAACGTPILAADSGTVKIAGYASSAEGNMVVVSHGIVNGNSLMTGYLHMSRVGATVGEHVNKGDVIGYVGSTGASTGCHLHFNVILNGAYVNPRPYLFG